MKNTFKIAGIIALIAVIGFSMAACSDPDDPVVVDFDSTTPNLTASVWSSEYYLSTSTSEAYFKFPIVSGVNYYIHIRDWDTSGVYSTSGYADVRVEAKYGSRYGDTAMSYVDTGSANSPSSAYFTANRSGYAYVRVYPHPSYSRYGYFRVAYTINSSTRPSGETVSGGGGGNPTPPPDTDSTDWLTNGSWSYGTLNYSYSEVWCRFNVNSGTTYYIYIDDYDTQNLSYQTYADVKFDLRYGSRTGSYIFNGTDLSSGYYGYFTANQTTTVYMKIYPLSGTTHFGYFRVAYRTIQSRPQ